MTKLVENQAQAKPMHPGSTVRHRPTIPPASVASHSTLETTGHLPQITQQYAAGDLLALIIHHQASDLHLRVGDPPPCIASMDSCCV